MSVTSRQFHIPLPQRETMSAEDFMVTASNREAAAWLLNSAPAAWPSHALILPGPHGCGKTHLLTAWMEKSGAQKIGIGETAVLRGLLNGTTDGNRKPKAFALDDADATAGIPVLEEWLQHLYNATQAAQTPLVLTALKPPAQWGLTLQDIASRLKSCAAIDMREPDDDLMRGMLVKQFTDRQLRVETEVIDYLLPRIERTGSAIRSAVAALDKKALEESKRITIPFVRDNIGQSQRS